MGKYQHQTAILHFLVLLFLASCASVKKQNEQLEKFISPAHLQQDVDYVQKKLYRKHPNVNLYISKSDLDAKFDSLRKTLHTAMQVNDFQLHIAPIIAAVHQGHMRIFPLKKAYTSKEIKAFKAKGKNPYTKLDYFWKDGHLYVSGISSAPSNIAIGDEIVSINGIKPQEIWHINESTFTSDGYNTSFFPKFFINSFVQYMQLKTGVPDSLHLELKHDKHLYISDIYRKSKDSTATKAILINKKQKKEASEKKKIFGYDEEDKVYNRTLKFVGKDRNIAVLVVKGFASGEFKKAYKLIFDTIALQKSKTLILDLRDNRGGSAYEIVHLYSYLTDVDYKFYQPAEVCSKTSLMSLNFFAGAPKLAYPFLAIYYPFYAVQKFLNTHKNKDKYEYFGLKGIKSLPPNPKHFTGKIYVLINGGSFSAAAVLSARLQANPKITFVGEETGGAFNSTVAGKMPVFKLPNSRLPWRLGTMQIMPFNQTPIIGRGVFPNHKVLQTIADIRQHRDPEMEYVLGVSDKL